MLVMQVMLHCSMPGSDGEADSRQSKTHEGHCSHPAALKSRLSLWKHVRNQCTYGHALRWTIYLGSGWK